MGNKKQCVADKISNLPDDLIKKILACLSLKSAAQTSLLSKQWRNRWVLIPKLVFDDTFSNLSKSGLFKTIYHVLLFLPHPIPSFSLCVSGLKSCVEIDHLMLFLSKRQIQEFTLVMNINNGERHAISSSMFDFDQLCYLKLSSCVFRIPFSFEGFFNLKSICFENVDLNGKCFEKILQICPFIEDINIQECTNFECLVVGAPKLQHFFFTGTIEKICFKNSPVLSKLHIHPSMVTGKDVVEPVDLVESFACFPSLQSISMNYPCLVAFTKYGPIAVSLPTMLVSLKTLILGAVCLDTLGDVCIMFCLIRSSPNFQELHLMCEYDSWSDGDETTQFMEAQDLCDTFTNLRELKMVGFAGLEGDMVFDI